MVLKSVAVSAVVSALALAGLTSASFAATTINVVEDGEGGAAMSLKLDPATVKAGETTFSVKNAAATEVHEMIVVKLKSADQKIPLNTTKHRVDESKLKSLGEVSDLKAGATGELTANLKPGTYLVFCNLKGHYEAGMQATLTVTP
jgi:uncharacterized cupredoxin-like copper-binding protein